MNRLSIVNNNLYIKYDFKGKEYVVYTFITMKVVWWRQAWLTMLLPPFFPSIAFLSTYSQSIDEWEKMPEYYTLGEV